VEQGQELGVIVGGEWCEKVRWAHTSDSLVVGLGEVATELLRPRRQTSPRQVAGSVMGMTFGTLVAAAVTPQPRVAQSTALHA
jgi:hypothetical protein